MFYRYTECGYESYVNRQNNHNTYPPGNNCPKCKKGIMCKRK